jgi:catechol 2,3-dioxygenase-like lactoylglutathione lyase family enzyme
MTPLTLDHVVIAVRDLDVASDSYRRLLGRTPSWRGRHPTYGTANVLFRLDNTYVELLAPADGDGDDSAWLQGLREHLDSAGEGLYAIALGTEDIDGAVASARSQGLEVFDPADGDGVDLESGARREWRNARIPPAATRGVRTFFIQHRSARDALPAAPRSAEDGTFVTGVDHTVVVSSHLAACLRLWHETFGIDLRRTLGPPGGRQLHFLRLGDSILELAGKAEPERPRERDLLWGVAYRVGDVARTVARLRSDGVNVSDAREGNAPGTLVADLKPGFSHDVRTLLIQHEERPGG